MQRKLNMGRYDAPVSTIEEGRQENMARPVMIEGSAAAASSYTYKRAGLHSWLIIFLEQSNYSLPPIPQLMK
jgi:hypothetical protein